VKSTAAIELTDPQRAQLNVLEREALAFNEKLNLYSQASAEDFLLRHVAHSLTLATRTFPAGSVVADWGTGGGMPGLVLAVVFPEVAFHLIDSVGKKIRAVQAMARRIGLDNIEAHHTRAEQWGGRVTHSVSRATAPLDTLWTWHSRVAVPMETGGDDWESGLLCLKGGDLRNEITDLEAADADVQVTTAPVRTWLDDPYFEDKVLVQVTRG
jgi:16S rRNA (guanine527-N7)-methyltransferase